MTYQAKIVRWSEIDNFFTINYGMWPSSTAGIVIHQQQSMNKHLLNLVYTYHLSFISKLDHHDIYMFSSPDFRTIPLFNLWQIVLIKTITCPDCYISTQKYYFNSTLHRTLFIIKI